GQMTAANLRILQAEHAERRSQWRNLFDSRIDELDRFQIRVAECQLFERRQAGQMLEIATVFDCRTGTGVPHRTRQIHHFQPLQSVQPLEVRRQNVRSDEIDQFELKIASRQLREIAYPL